MSTAEPADRRRQIALLAPPLVTAARQAALTRALAQAGRLPTN